ESVAIGRVDLVAVAVALGNLPGPAIDSRNVAVAAKHRFVSAEPHRAAQLAFDAALLQSLLAHPLGYDADHGLLGRTELRRTGFGIPCGARRFDAGHLHPETDT